MAETAPLQLDQTLAQKTATKLALRVALVIILMTAISYYHVAALITDRSLEQLNKYIIERGHREGELFKLAEANHRVLKDYLIEQLQSPPNNEIESRFNKLVEKYSDGVTRNRRDKFDGSRESFIYIGKNVAINTEVQQRVLSFYDLSNQFGPAWHHRFQNVYFITLDNILVGFWF